MGKNRKKIARTVKSREQLLVELKSNQKFVEKMQFTKEKFYPAVVSASRNIEDAQSFLYSISNILMEKFLGFMKEKTFADLKLIDALDAKDPKFEEYKALLSLFDAMSVFEAKDLIEGMKNEIQLFINEELKTRGMETLRPVWLDELK